MATTIFHAATFTPGTPTNSGWDVIDGAFAAERIHVLKELGYTHLLLRPAWHWLQPRPHQVSTTAINALERLLDSVQAHGLTAITSLLDVDHYGILALPDWHNAPDVIGWMQKRTTQPVLSEGRPVLVNGRLHHLRMANPYTTSELVRAQRMLVETVMRYFAGHPAATHWLIAHGWSRLANAPKAIVRPWWEQLTEAARAAQPQATLLASVDYPNATRHTLNIPTLAARVDMLIGLGTWPELTKQTQRPLSAPSRFVHTVVQGLSSVPVLTWLPPLGHSTTSSHWLPISWHDQPWSLPVLSLTDQQRWSAAMYTGLQRAGSQGVIVTEPLGGYPPTNAHDHSWWPHLATQTHPDLVDMVRQQHQQWHEAGPAVERIDAERYWHAPVSECARLWHEFA